MSTEEKLVIAGSIILLGSVFGVLVNMMYGISLSHQVQATVGQPVNAYHSDGIQIVNYTVTYVAPNGQTFTAYQPISCSLYTAGSKISATYQPAFGLFGAQFYINWLPKDC